VTFVGWKTVSGYNKNVYGRSNPTFMIIFAGLADYYSTLWWRSMNSSGVWSAWQSIPGSQAVDLPSGNGTVVSLGNLNFDASMGDPTDGTTQLQFGVQGTNYAGAFFNSSARNMWGTLVALCFNG
jgi:hypothetical protein